MTAIANALTRSTTRTFVSLGAAFTAGAVAKPVGKFIYRNTIGRLGAWWKSRNDNEATPEAE